MPANIRNFCILAHVDHGKSTVADRFLTITGTVSPSQFQPQFLDSNPISRERGITIKLAPVRMRYKLPHELKKIFNFEFLIFNLIDTPGHVDFSYEVSRTLAACEGALLLVDATQGIQAQTISYWQKARQQGLTIIPVVNKIDLSAASPEETAMSMVETFDFFVQEEIIFISAKTGEGVGQLLETIARRIPPPKGDPSASLRALVFDSFYDAYKGVVICVRLVDGEIRLSPQGCYKLMGSGKTFSPLEMGYFTPQPTPSSFLENGAVGYLATGLKDIRSTRVGETVTKLKIKNEKLKIYEKEVQPLPGYQQPKPMVFVGVYPLDQGNYSDLEDALGKLSLNDASFSYLAQSSSALGKGFLVGLLGPLHAEVTLQRLEREFGLELITTVPNVEYEIKISSSTKVTEDKKNLKIKNLSEIPSDYEKIFEPVMKVTIFSPKEYLGGILKLCQERRGKLSNIEYVGDRARLEYKLPLSEIIVDFFERLKSLSSGFAWLDYQFLGYYPADLVKLDILVAGKKVDALSRIVPRSKAYQVGEGLVERLSRVIPRQLYEVAIQAAIGKRVVARKTLKAFRKDVTAKLYGGDQTRKDKLLEKQKRGKKKLKAVGKILIPQEAFLAVLKSN